MWKPWKCLIFSWRWILFRTWELKNAFKSIAWCNFINLSQRLSPTATYSTLLSYLHVCTCVSYLKHVYATFFLFRFFSFCFFKALHGFHGRGRCQEWTTTLSVLETSGSWKRVDFCWRVGPMMVGINIVLKIWETCVCGCMHLCTRFTLTALYNGVSVSSIFTVIMTYSLP